MSIITRSRITALVAALSFFSLATNAFAQLGGRSPDGGGRGPGGDSRSGPPRSVNQEPRVDLFEETLHELRQDLKLTPAQQSAWDSYEAKIRALVADMKRERIRRMQQAEEPKTALQRIDQMTDNARNRLAALEEIADAAKSLYAVLTPEQKTIADARLASVIPGTNGPMSGGTPPGPDGMRGGPGEMRPRFATP